MSNIKNRVAKLEASAPMPAEDRITEIHRVIVGKVNPDGTPVTIVRHRLLYGT